MAYFINFEKYSGSQNMEIDRALLDFAIENSSSPILRLYGWKKPTLTLGRNQSNLGINQQYCEFKEINIVKRPTGGRAVLHDNELTYCFIASTDFFKNGNSVIESYKEISQALILGFAKLGIPLAFPDYKKVSVKDGYCMAISTGSDLNYNGKKLIGSAQFRKQNYILQHGSILIDIDNTVLSNIFGSEDTQPNHITLKSILPNFKNIDELANCIKSGFEECFSIDFQTLTEFQPYISKINADFD